MLFLFAAVASNQQSQQAPDVLEPLIYAISAGDRDSLAELYRRTRTAVYALALSYLKNGQDAEDVVQDTFVRIWDNAYRYQSKGKPMAWILTIGKNLTLMKLRERKKTEPLPTDETSSDLLFPSPALSTEERQLLCTALETLSTSERQVLLLHAVTGLKHREIAALLELPLATVLSKYHRSLKKLQTKLEGDASF